MFSRRLRAEPGNTDAGGNALKEGEKSKRGEDFPEEERENREKGAKREEKPSRGLSAAVPSGASLRNRVQTSRSGTRSAGVLKPPCAISRNDVTKRSHTFRLSGAEAADLREEDVREQAFQKSPERILYKTTQTCFGTLISKRETVLENESFRPQLERGLSSLRGAGGRSAGRPYRTGGGGDGDRRVRVPVSRRLGTQLPLERTSDDSRFAYRFRSRRDGDGVFGSAGSALVLFVSALKAFKNGFSEFV